MQCNNRLKHSLCELIKKNECPTNVSFPSFIFELARRVKEYTGLEKKAQTLHSEWFLIFYFKGGSVISLYSTCHKSQVNKWTLVCLLCSYNIHEHTRNNSYGIFRLF